MATQLSSGHQIGTLGNNAFGCHSAPSDESLLAHKKRLRGILRAKSALRMTAFGKVCEIVSISSPQTFIANIFPLERCPALNRNTQAHASTCLFAVSRD
jgi:hypothetical protein